MKHKNTKIAFWVSTAIFGVVMSFTAFLYLTSAEIAGAFIHLGFPSYFRIELGLFKFVGTLTLLIPTVPKVLKEWAYAGFFITLVSAFTAHVAVGDGPEKYMAPVIFGAVLTISYFCYQRLATITETEKEES